MSAFSEERDPCEARRGKEKGLFRGEGDLSGAAIAIKKVLLEAKESLK